MGVRSVAVYSEADAHSAHVAACDEAVAIGPSPAAQSYLDAGKILEAARRTGAQAIHPGYGFLSENPAFAEACAAAGIVFIGPTAAQMRAFGLKHAARALAEKEKVPLLPGSGLLSDERQALAEAARIGYPVMLKSTAGGGGIGMQLIHRPRDLPPWRPWPRSSGWPETISRKGASTWRNSSSRRATSKCRFSATGRGPWSHWENATVRRSGAIRR